MTILLNGQDREVPDSVTILGLLETIGQAPGRVAVEVNGRVVPRAEFQRLTLRADDRVEIVQIVGGG